VIWLLVIFTNDDWVLGAAVLFILFIGFFGIRQAGVFHSPENSLPDQGVAGAEEVKDDLIDRDSEFQSEGEKRKYQKSGLSAEASDTLHRQLTQLMREKKLYCESELSLTELATHLGTQPNHL